MMEGCCGMLKECEKEYLVCPRTGRPLRPARKSKWKYRLFFWIYPLISFLALLWFLIRVIPKPTRALYPCQRVAAPMASSFVIFLLGLSISTTILHKVRFYLLKSRYAFIALCLLALALSVYIPVNLTGRLTTSVDPGWYVPSDPANSPMGVARGYYPGRVVWKHDPNATSWSGEGETNYWWLDENTDQVVVERMLSESLCDLVHADNDGQAWQRIFEYFNQTHGYGTRGYLAGEKIAVKINMNMTSGHIEESNGNFTAPQVILALLRQLVYSAGVDPCDITFYDACRFVPDQIYNRCHPEFPGTHFVDWIGGDGREQVTRDLQCPVLWSDDLQDPTEYYGTEPTGYPTYLPTCVSNADYIINLANLKGHRTAGITVCAKNNFGSICAGPDPGPGVDRCVPKYAGIHPYVVTHDTYYSIPTWQWARRDMGTYNPLVDLSSHQELGEKTLLFMIDALYAANHMAYELAPECRWLSAPFNNDWTSSLFLSLDGVALDSVALDFLRSEPVIQNELHVMDPNDTIDNYLHEAALANDPPSGCLYDPQGDEQPPASLGVHEHWNNAAEKLYSRNLRTGDGIELVQSPRCPADINGGGVNMEDLLILAEHWLDRNCGVTDGWCYGADLNNDGGVDLNDFNLLTSYWN